MLKFGTGLTLQGARAPVPLLPPQPQPQPLPTAAAGMPAVALPAFAAPAPAPLLQTAAGAPAVALPTPEEAPSSSNWQPPTSRHSGSSAGSSAASEVELDLMAKKVKARDAFDEMKAAQPTPKRDRTP